MSRSDRARSTDDYAGIFDLQERLATAVRNELIGS